MNLQPNHNHIAESHKQMAYSMPTHWPRNRWLWAVMLVFIGFVLTPTQSARAEEKIIYLPLIGHETDPPLDQQFTVEWVRLWSVWENGGRSQPLTCGNRGGILQVDVFDLQGEGSQRSGTINGRLNDVTVAVTHDAADGSRRVITATTGSENFDDGVALFALADTDTRTTVQIRTEIDGELVASPPITVTTATAAIPTAMLLDAGYCTDDTTCRALIEAEQCSGTFSWGVVFKRMF